MDIELVTILFCFILLIINTLIFARQTSFFNLYRHSIELRMAEIEKTRTILAILQKIEAKIDFYEVTVSPESTDIEKKRGRPKKTSSESV